MIYLQTNVNIEPVRNEVTCGNQRRENSEMLRRMQEVQRCDKNEIIGVGNYERDWVMAIRSRCLERKT